MIKIIEGELIRTISSDEDINLEEIVKEIYCGYILILVNEDNKLYEGYIFVDDGDIVGYYFTDNKKVDIFGDKDKVMELLNCKNRTIELYKYDKNKMNLMKWLYPEIFVIKKDEKEKIENEEKLNAEKYINIKLNIPLDKLMAINVKDLKQYLGENKYILIHAYRKSYDIFENGYIIYKGKTPIATAYECNMGTLFGDDAYKKIISMLEDENTIIDVYEYDEKKLEVLLETYPEMKLKSDEEITSNKEEIVDEIEITSESVSEAEEEDINLSREELLKKLGIKEPDEKWVDSIIEELFRPSEEELQELKEKIEEEIIEKLKKIDSVEKVEPDIKITWENGRYYIVGNINVKRKRILGIIKKDVDVSLIKFIIDTILRKYAQTYTSRLTVNVI